MCICLSVCLSGGKNGTASCHLARILPSGVSSSFLSKHPISRSRTSASITAAMGGGSRTWNHSKSRYSFSRNDYEGKLTTNILDRIIKSSIIWHSWAISKNRAFKMQRKAILPWRETVRRYQAWATWWKVPTRAEESCAKKQNFTIVMIIVRNNSLIWS